MKAINGRGKSLSGRDVVKKPEWKPLIQSWVKNMPQIKGWQKLEYSTYPAWQNETTGLMVGIEKLNGSYFACGRMPENQAFELYDVNQGNMFTNKKTVIDLLKGYMRDNFGRTL